MLYRNSYANNLGGVRFSGMGVFFPARIITAAMLVAMLVALLCAGPALGRDAQSQGQGQTQDQRQPERGDGTYMTLSLNNVSYIIDPQLKDLAALTRSDASVYFSRGDERVYLGDIDVNSPGAGADVIVLDANFDGRPEFLLKFDSSDTNQYYYLVDDTGTHLGEALFGDPEMEFCNPTFQSATRSITAWDRSSGLASYALYKFHKGRYALSEETEPVYEASRLMLERRTEYLGPEKTRSTLRYYGDTTNKPVRLRVVSKAPLYAQADDEAPSGKYVQTGETVVVMDAAVGEGGHMLKVGSGRGRAEGWVPEEAFLVRLTQNAFLAAGPGSQDAAPENLSAPSIPANTELPVRAARQSRGETWLEVYYLEGDAAGWIRASETTPAPLPERP